MGSAGKEAILCESFEDFERQNISSQLSKTAVVDYHFDNSEIDGAEIIRRLRKRGFTNLYLCTAEYWKPSTQKLVEELNVEICPKPLPKIVVASPEQSRGAKQSREEMGIASSSFDKLRTSRNDKAGYKVLVIDDDKVIRMGWELMRERLHIENLHCYPNLESVMDNNVDLASIDIAFVDKNIEGSKFSGAEVIQHLKSRQVTKIVLASGENEETLRQDPQFTQADFIVSEKIPTSFKEFFS